MKPMSYKEQDGCHNCKFSLLEIEPDSDDKWFCEHNEKMPLYDHLYRYYQWRDNHRVEPYGICDYWEEHKTKSL